MLRLIFFGRIVLEELCLFDRNAVILFAGNDISDVALQQLSTFAFPGNVRQLENICHWLTVMAPAQVIEPKDLPPEVLGATPDQARHLPPPDLSALSRPAMARPDAPMAGGAGAEGVVAGTPAAEPVFTTIQSPGSSAGAESGGQTWQTWEEGLEVEAQALLATGRSDVWDVLTRRFESRLIQTALLNTRGRRIEAAQQLGIGRNTITRKIQELNLE